MGSGSWDWGTTPRRMALRYASAGWVRWTTRKAECRLCGKDLSLRWTTHEELDNSLLTRADAAGDAVSARVGDRGRPGTRTGVRKQGEGTFAENP